MTKESSDTPGRRRDTQSKAKRYLVGLPIFVIAYLAVVLLSLYPSKPIDLAGWVILILGGIPANLFAEWTGSVIFSDRLGRKLSRKTFSVKRIFTGLFAMLALIIIYRAAWWALSPMIRRHFS